MKITRGNHGFSLVEALVAMAMASVIVVVIGSALASVYRVYSASTMKQEALAYGQESLDLITAYANSTNMFACVCNPHSAPCASCSAGDGQSCAPLQGYTSCWTQYPRGLSANNAPAHLINTEGFWKFDTTLGSDTPSAGFSRAVTVSDLCRDSLGVLDAAGCTEDYNSKKITVIVSWTERAQTKSVQMSKILNGWRSL